MSALLFMFIAFFLKHRGNAWPSIFNFARKKVILDHFYFINQLDFDCLLFVTVTLANLKEVYLEINNDLRYEFYYTRLFSQTERWYNFVHFVVRALKSRKELAVLCRGIFSAKKKNSFTSTLHKGASSKFCSASNI